MKNTTGRIFHVMAVMLIGGLVSACSSVSAGDVTKLVALDKARATTQPKSDLLWYDARDLLIEGKGWADTETFYERIPLHAKGKVTPQVWALSKHTACIAVRFVSDTSQIWANWDGGGAMNHMAATGNSGLDLYRRIGTEWKFSGTGRPSPERTTASVGRNLPAEPTEYLLYLPLYNKVTELKIGIEPGAMIAKAPARPQLKSRLIVFYGTSITQGGCAARAGMCHAAMLGRWLNREVINLGFSGAGKMEPEMAELLGELDPAVYVLECLPNMNEEMVRERVEPFVHILRRLRPDTPLLIVEHPNKSGDDPQNKALRQIFENLSKQGVKHMRYLPAGVQLAGQENGTVDNSHPTDLGFFRMATAYRPVLVEMLANDR